MSDIGLIEFDPNKRYLLLVKPWAEIDVNALNDLGIPFLFVEDFDDMQCVRPVDIDGPPTTT